MRPVLAVFLFCAPVSDLCAQDQQVGARAKAMGGGYTAFDDDPISLWLNPAGIATQSDGGLITYQSYTVYPLDFESGTTDPFSSSSRMGWADPAIVPSFLGATFQLGTAESPMGLGVCFAAPYRLELGLSDAPSKFQFLDQTFSRIRVAYAHGFRLRPPGSAGFFTHLSLGVGVDLSFTRWTFRDLTDKEDVDGKNLGFGAGAGLLVGIYDNTQNFKVNLGAAYQSAVSYNFTIDLPGTPLLDWPNQYQVGATFYLLEGLPLRLTLDAQLIEWKDAARPPTLAGVERLRNALNLSFGAEYRIRLSDRVRLYPRAGLRLYRAPWGDARNLPGVGAYQLFIETDDDTFWIGSVGLGVVWTSDSQKARSIDVAADFGGDVPTLALSFFLEF